MTETEYLKYENMRANANISAFQKETFRQANFGINIHRDLIDGRPGKRAYHINIAGIKFAISEDSSHSIISEIQRLGLTSEGEGIGAIRKIHEQSAEQINAVIDAIKEADWLIEDGMEVLAEINLQGFPYPESINILKEVMYATDPNRELSLIGKPRRDWRIILEEIIKKRQKWIQEYERQKIFENTLYQGLEMAKRYAGYKGMDEWGNIITEKKLLVTFHHCGVCDWCINIKIPKGDYADNIILRGGHMKEDVRCLSANQEGVLIAEMKRIILRPDFSDVPQGWRDLLKELEKAEPNRKEVKWGDRDTKLSIKK